MDVDRFRALYAAEAEEHLQRLTQSILALEAGGEEARQAVAAAFRAAHTLKGMAASMGYTLVTEQAHALEDRLDAVRAGTLEVDPELVDALLAAADRLQAAALDPSPDVAAAAAPAGTAGRDRAGPARPAGVPAVRVRLEEDAPIKAARALLAVAAARAVGGVVGTLPAEFDEAFDGRFLVLLEEDADAEAVTVALRAAGEVASATVERGDSQAAGRSGPARATATQVRVDQRRLDEVAERVAELAVLQGRLAEYAGELDVAAVNGMGDVASRISTVASELQHAVLSMRMVPVADVFQRFPRVVRDAARSLGKDVELVMEGQDIELDRAILDEIVDPIVHLLRNAVDHGLEGNEARRAAGKVPRGQIRLAAERERTSVRITLQDDGGGVHQETVVERAQERGILPADFDGVLEDDELFRILSHPGFSTAAAVTEVSGRGVGLDAVVNRVRALGGAIDMRTRTGQGTDFVMRLPLTLAVAPALQVRVGQEIYAVPLTHVSEAVDFALTSVRVDGTGEWLVLRDEPVRLIRMRAVLGVDPEGGERAAVVAESGERRFALGVDEIVRREQILVKAFHPGVGALPLFSGATLLADGRPALVLDPLSVS
ncbi:MAG: chemotaxis protein CheA [Gemmatimonadota bacterium]